jgi:hypothetical protein
LRLEERETGYLKPFFLFLLVDAQGARKVQQEARRGARHGSPSRLSVLVVVLHLPVSLVERGGGSLRPPFGLELLGESGLQESPSLAVALNCGIGSSSLNAEVNALERLHIVRGRNCSYFGSK